MGKSKGPARMSRSAGGGTSHSGVDYAVGPSSGEKGMGSHYSGGGNKGRSQAFAPGGMKTSRMGNTVSHKMPNRYEAVTHNPSGAANNALKNSDVTMSDDN